MNGMCTRHIQSGVCANIVILTYRGLPDIVSYFKENIANLYISSAVNVNF